MSFCVKCGRPANLMCSRCFDPYCEISCQISDWLVHKKICMPMPELISIELLNLNVEASKNSEAPQEQKIARVPEKYESGKRAIVKLTKNEICKDSESSFKGSTSMDMKLPNSPKSTSKQQVKENSEQTKFFLNDVEVIPIREGSNISLVVTDASFLDKYFFSAYDTKNKARIEMVRNLEKLKEYCTIAERDKRGYNPQLNEMCLAVFEEDQNWYRAFALKESPNGDTYVVQFVDYGNIKNVTRNDIMPITNSLMFPTCTNLCRIINIEECDLPRLKKYIDDNTVIVCDVHYSQNMDVYEVTISNAEKILK